MDRKTLGLLVWLALWVVTAGCTGPTNKPPTPTIWYLVVTSTPAPTPTKFVPRSPTPAPPTVAPQPTPPGPPAPTTPPLPTHPPTRPPTVPPPPPTVLPASPTPLPTFTPGPAPTSPPTGQCQGDEEMSFEPATPKVGEKLTIHVTSAKAHRNVRLNGPGVAAPADPVVSTGGKGHIWSWTATVPQAGRLNYTFLVEVSTPCTANYCTAVTAAGVQLTCGNPHVTSAPGKVAIMVTMQNTGSAAGTFNINISKALPEGWQGMFCLGTTCYFTGPVPRTLEAGASEQIEVDIIIPDTAPAGQQGNVTISVISQSDASVNAALTVSATRQ